MKIIEAIEVTLLVTLKIAKNFWPLVVLFAAVLIKELFEKKN